MLDYVFVEFCCVFVRLRSNAEEYKKRRGSKGEGRMMETKKQKNKLKNKKKMMKKKRKKMNKKHHVKFTANRKKWIVWRILTNNHNGAQKMESGPTKAIVGELVERSHTSTAIV